ncbi:NAD(P)-dependent oxidoreductase [Caulobacter sp. UNC358MFTsu5.1]|uniref:NAD-dependent epimerase/dehydratase family protein n=1 Tax=Caulobacter sp. UNC358MFTsu5.1 TaxID=1449049 RepID=UPI0004A6DC05|nr:NAD(P)-dependent oxidoreductase [Caulobacter sp. UNC358MFTsu5.1]
MQDRVFVAGASGVIGRRLVALLLRDGHAVVGATRSAERARWLQAAGAQAVIVDVLDAEALKQAVCEAGPRVVINQLTDLAGLAASPDATRKSNARVRRVGTQNLMRAAAAAGTTRVIAQSIAWAYAPGTPPYTEQHALDLAASGMRGTTILEGVVPLEAATLQTEGVDGVVLRYGQLYGPGAWSMAPDGASPLHVDAAAYAASLAVGRGRHGVYNIAESGAEADNAKALAELGWRPGFRLDA